jgi:hypothetical protein
MGGATTEVPPKGETEPSSRFWAGEQVPDASPLERLASEPFWAGGEVATGLEVGALLSVSPAIGPTLGSYRRQREGQKTIGRPSTSP